MLLLDELNEKIYLKWKKKGNHIITQLREGFSKIDFGSPEPLEIQNINNALKALEQKDTITREEYGNNIKILKENLNALALNKDFNNAHVNNFIFQSRQSINRLLLAFISNHYKYAEAVIYPAGKMEQAPNKAQDFIMGRGAKEISKILFKNFDEEVTAYLKIQVQRLQDPTKIESIDIKPKKATLILEQIMGEKNYKATQSHIKINSPNEVAAYVSEQIYGLLFETFYSQVTLMQDIQSKINKLSEKGENLENIKKIRKDLLSKAGLAELDPDGIHYLNKISKILGFDNAQAVYKNSMILDTQEGFDQFKELKEKFVDMGPDVLQQIKNETNNENQRIKQKIKDSQINHNSATYVLALSHLAKEIPEAINFAQISKNIASNLADDFLPKNFLKGDKNLFTQFAAMIGKTIINNQEVKKYIDSFSMSGIIQESSLLSQRLQDVFMSIYSDWSKMINEQMQEALKERRKILTESILGVDSEHFLNNYIESVLNNEIYTDNFYKASQLFPNSSEYIKIEKQFNESKEKYINFHDAFINATNNKIYNFTESVPIIKFTEERKNKIQFLSNSLEHTQRKERQLNTSIENNETSIKGKIIRWRDNIASLVGIKTKTMLRREKQQQELQKLSAQIARNQIGINIQRDLLNQATVQKKLIHKIDKLNIHSLYSQLETLFENYQAVCHQIANDSNAMISQTNVSKKIFLDQQKLKKLDNKLNLTMKTFLTQLNEEPEAISLNEIKGIQQKIIDANSSKNAINHMFSIPQEAVSPSFSVHTDKINSILNDKNKILQQQLLEKNIQQVTPYLQANPFDIDPFKWLSSQLALGDLTDESKSKLYEHVQHEAMSWLHKAELPIQALQNIYLQLQIGYQEASLEASDNDFLKENYQPLLQACHSKINEYYAKIGNLSAINLKDELPSLQANFEVFKTEYDNVKNYNESLKNAGWFSNPFGLIHTNSLNQSDISVVAYRERLHLFITDYEKVLKNYLEKSQTFFSSLTKEELLIHKESIDKNLRYFSTQKDEEKRFLQIQEHHKEMLKAAQFALEQDQKNSHLEDITNQSLKTLELKHRDLKNFTESLNKSLALPENFKPIDAFNTYNDYMKDVFEEINTVENNIKKLSVLYEKNPEMKLALKLKKDQLEKIKFDFHNNQGLYLNPLSFYYDLAKGNLPSKSQIDNKTLGKGLIIGIAYRNPHTASLLNPSFEQDEQEPIDAFDLNAALVFAAKKADIEIIKKIFAYRDDITFSSSQIFSAIKEAMKSAESEVVQYLIFNTNFIPDEKAITSIASRTNTIKSPLPPVERGWIPKLMVDEDDALLDTLHKWYTFEYQLYDSLKMEYELIKKNAQQNITQSTINDIQVLLNKIKRIEDINEHSSLLAKNLRFQTPESQIAHIDKWEEKIKSYLSEYRNTLQAILEPADKLTMSDFTVGNSSFDITRRDIEKLISEGNTITLNQLQEFKDMLNKLILVSSKPNELEIVLQNSLNQLAKLNQSDAIDAILNVCQDKHKQEMMAGALSQAINTGSSNAASFLIKKRAYIGHEEELLAKLFKIIQENKDNVEKLAPHHDQAYDMAYELLTHAPLSLLDNTGKLDKNIIDILKNKRFVSDKSKIPDIEKTWLKWYRGDYSKLEALRQTYVFAENAYKKLSMDVFLTLQPLAEQEVDSLTDLDVDYYERQLNLITSNLTMQLQNIDKLKSLYHKSCYSDAFKEDEIIWQSTLATIKDTCNNNIMRYIEDAKIKIKHYHQASKEESISKEERFTKRSFFLSQNKKQEKLIPKNEISQSQHKPKGDKPGKF